MRFSFIALATALILATPAAATAPAPFAPANPAPAAWAQAEKAAPAKPKRKRSEAQLKNDARLRACGVEWRQDKAALVKKGYNWIRFSGECRKRLAAQGR